MNDNIINKLAPALKAKTSSRDIYKQVFTTADGKDVEYEIIATFINRTRQKFYYIMTDNTKSENNELNISAFYVEYEGEDDDLTEADEGFYPVEDDEELAMVMDVFNQIKGNL